MNGQQKQKLRNAFDSILRAYYISLDDLEELGDLEDYFIDFFGMLQSVLQKQDSFISGRRGTGKTTNLLRGYYECLKTISPKMKSKSGFLQDTKVLPIYIDLNTCNDLFDSREDQGLIEIHFIRQMIESLRNQLELMFDAKYLAIFKKENPALDDLDLIEKLLVEGVTVSKSKMVSVTDKTSDQEEVEASGKVSGTGVKVSGAIKDTCKDENTTVYNTVQGLNVQDFLNKIGLIKKKANIDAIYVFIDEYSDLTKTSQEKFSKLLKSFLGSKVGIFFKVGVITDRYDFGDKVIIGRDIFHIPLDFNEYAERYNGAIAAINKTEEFVSKLIKKRIEKFCPELSLESVFKANFSEVVYRVTRETLGVSRTIGMILQNSFIQASSSDDGRIGLADINYGISSARKTYQKQFSGSVKKRLVAGFYMDMWNSILNKAIAEKNKYPDRPASHFMLDPIRKEYLNVLCENFLVHFISENVTSKHGGNYNLYSLDYDVCIEYGIKYANKKDEYTPIRFIYDSVLSEFDPYFLNARQKSYKCPVCNKIYSEDELQMIKFKRCFEDDELLTEIIHQESPVTHGNFVEVEVKILGLISQLSFEEAMTAREIADSVGCTVQKISAWAGRVLEKKGDIKVNKAIKPHKYYSNDELE